MCGKLTLERILGGGTKMLAGAIVRLKRTELYPLAAHPLLKVFEDC